MSRARARRGDQAEHAKPAVGSRDRRQADHVRPFALACVAPRFRARPHWRSNRRLHVTNGAVGKRGVTRYHAYGVSVVSELPLPFPAEPPSDGRRALARVEFVEANDGDFHGFPSASMPADTFICDDVPGRGAYLRWPGLYDFVVDEPGSRIACRALDGCNASVFHNFLFGQVVAAALVRQGLEPLHAAAVAIEDGAIAFLGDCTYGKSTLLASFAQAGHRALTDDMLILERDAGEFHAWPGAGRVKLMPDSARRILRRSDGVQLTPLTTK